MIETGTHLFCVVHVTATTNHFYFVFRDVPFRHGRFPLAETGFSLLLDYIKLYSHGPLFVVDDSSLVPVSPPPHTHTHSLLGRKLKWDYTFC